MTPEFANPPYKSDRAWMKRCAQGHVVIIDDDLDILMAFKALLDLEGYACETFSSALDYLEVLPSRPSIWIGPQCVLCDIKMPLMDGLELQRQLALQDDVPLLLMSGSSGAEEAVTAFRAGALDFLIKPIDADVLLTAINQALAVSATHHQTQVLTTRLETLTARELEVARRVAAGQRNNDIALELNIALRTVKLYRHRAMEKLEVTSVAELVRIIDACQIKTH
ncbi:response regulator transcription factor [Rhodoferax sp. 4810]|uniref:Response regulator transcription factor n=1 Tax=Thiospirillum jenense TaxID=1653858 RepID=A0A839HJM7_9GAMM|nr:response regulator [Thiospirillum jenense]MBB1075120.1 response regulator transcription factor [Rhodoferax jenense]MBB1126769.1 response regulator transcription factor [Thiospirillum jenense]